MLLKMSLFVWKGAPVNKKGEECQIQTVPADYFSTAQQFLICKI
jgi:hypothetical protein